MENTTITLFTQTSCADSVRVRDRLQARDISFVERNVTNDPKATEELATQEFFATPLLVVGQRKVIGFRPAAMEAGLKKVNDRIE